MTVKLTNKQRLLLELLDNRWTLTEGLLMGRVVYYLTHPTRKHDPHGICYVERMTIRSMREKGLICLDTVNPTVWRRTIDEP